MLAIGLNMPCDLVMVAVGKCEMKLGDTLVIGLSVPGGSTGMLLVANAAGEQAAMVLEYGPDWEGMRY